MFYFNFQLINAYSNATLSNSINRFFLFEKDLLIALVGVETPSIPPSPSVFHATASHVDEANNNLSSQQQVEADVRRDQEQPPTSSALAEATQTPPQQQQIPEKRKISSSGGVRLSDGFMNALLMEADGNGPSSAKKPKKAVAAVAPTSPTKIVAVVKPILRKPELRPLPPPAFVCFVFLY